MARIAAGNGDDQQQQPDPKVAELEARLAKYEQRDDRRELGQQLGIGDGQKIDAVRAVLEASPELQPSEALAIAQMRAPDLFGVENPAAFQPGTHGSLRPRGAGSTVRRGPKSLKERTADVIAIKDPIARKKAEYALFGAAAARACGWHIPGYTD
jgi:hypothetical protein